ncbi:myeloid leukemia factor 1 isoform X1 [Gadus morhua]|uniref:myeloid leukemia factor 1 isoform X1 n=1 Tax=Gadus morhua TaxID=8049 RepID=UPI0011B3654F|nr:myeloid leukemia factor 1-like isoform X1 [Gadus morhua]
MFNSLTRDFEEDPFFSSTRDPFQAHNDRVRQMMRSFSDPFGGSPFMSSLTDCREQRRGSAAPPGTSLTLRDEHRDADVRNPFSMLDNMMLNMRTRMDDMHKNFDNLSTDSSNPNSHSFSSSSVTTYSKVGNEPPKVFQASSQTRRAPGGITETRRALRDSESGLEKMAIGHHIQDRGHVVEKKHNKKTGEKELNQDFQNMDESEAQTFDKEFQSKLTQGQPSVPISRLEAPRAPRAVHQAALTASEPPHRERRVHVAEGKKQVHCDKVKGSGVAQQ